MSFKNDKILYWFTRDLRIDDNKILQSIQKASSLTCIFVVEPHWFVDRPWQQSSISLARWQFLMESIQNLKHNLIRYGHHLHILYGSSKKLIPGLVHEYDFNQLVLSKHSGSYELQTVKQIAEDCPNLNIREFEQYTLFTRSELPFNIANLPKTFSQFRKLIDNVPVYSPLPEPSRLPPMLALKFEQSERTPNWVPKFSAHLRFTGGETEGRQHLKEYFKSDAPSKYKAVRNELSGWLNSSKLSPWLNMGCISARQVKAALNNYQKVYGWDDSSEWIFVELLWREYFQWLHFKIGDRLFSFQGSKHSAPLTSFYPERFRKWCEGETPFKLVNACMKELKATGYLSNRGRQIVASCLVNELNLDWRFGAAWFEHTLIDYDVATNWGNWQYIAGVGVDPRGGRQFNLNKQAEIYDPDGMYQKRWNAESHEQLDSRDAADWPLPPS